MKENFSCLILLLIFASPAASEEIATSLEGPPLQYQEGTLLKGFPVDVVREIQARMGNNQAIQVYPWARLYRKALTTPDIVLFTMAKNAEREPHFYWIAKLTERTSSLYALKGSTLNLSSIDDAKSIPVVVMRGGNREVFLRKQGFQKIITALDESSSIQMLFNRRAEMVFMSKMEAEILARQSGFNPEEMQPVMPLYSNTSFIAISKQGTDKRLINSWVSHFEDMKSDGTFERIANNWIKQIRDNYGIEISQTDGVLQF
ncbi:MAG: transporter substrate-binding domain-containing protein [Halopseudomonas sp.]